jgi:hypothetical protein
MDEHKGGEERGIGHYVYLYRDRNDRPRYVGYGVQSGRATSHLTGSHNERLNRFLEARDYRLEIAGPFNTEREGRAVETALISALKPDLNVDPGQSQWRFRPLGVPLDFADRLVEPELVLADFLIRQGPRPNPVLFVINSSSTFADSRVGYDPASPPTDEQIRARLERWWQLAKYRKTWGANPSLSPGVLVGVFGSPGRQIVIAAASIDQSAWGRAEDCPEGGGRLRVPLLEPVDLDACGLRGRRISLDAGIRFGGIPSQFFAILRSDGVFEGGSGQRSAAKSG